MMSGSRECSSLKRAGIDRQLSIQSRDLIATVSQKSNKLDQICVGLFARRFLHPEHSIGSRREEQDTAVRMFPGKELRCQFRGNRIACIGEMNQLREALEFVQYDEPATGDSAYARSR